MIHFILGFDIMIYMLIFYFFAEMYVFPGLIKDYSQRITIYYVSNPYKYLEYFSGSYYDINLIIIYNPISQWKIPMPCSCHMEADLENGKKLHW